MNKDAKVVVYHSLSKSDIDSAIQEIMANMGHLEVVTQTIETYENTKSQEMNNDSSLRTKWINFYGVSIFITVQITYLFIIGIPYMLGLLY